MLCHLTGENVYVQHKLQFSDSAKTKKKNVTKSILVQFSFHFSCEMLKMNRMAQVTGHTLWIITWSGAMDHGWSVICLEHPLQV